MNFDNKISFHKLYHDLFYKKGMYMQTAKQEVKELLNRLPEDCTLEDVQYHLYVLQKVERGLKDAEEGRVYTQEEVEKMMAKWLSK